MQSTRVLRRTVLAATLAGVAAATTVAGPALADDATGSLSGFIRDTRGAVITDASVSIYPASSTDPIDSAQVDSRGRFSVTGLRAGSYQISIGMGGWSEWAPGRVTDRLEARTYRVAADRTTPANSVVTAAGIVTGRIFDTNGRPAANAGVSLSILTTASDQDGVTGADGTYRIRVRPNSTFKVAYQVGPFYQFVPHTYDSSQATRFYVAAGQTVRIPDDRAIPAAGITGRLTDAAGAPVGNAVVNFTNVDSAYPSDTTTAADGTYDFAGYLIPGRYKVEFRVAGRSQYSYQKPDYTSADVITVASGQTAIVDDQLLWVPAPQQPAS